MATRNRTLLYMQFRNAIARSHVRPRKNLEASGNFEISERAGLIANEVRQGADVVVELSILPPKWIDIVDEVEEEVELIRGKISELDALHKKHLLPGFDDKLSEVQSIDRLTESITSMFRDSEKKVKQISTESNATVLHSKQNVLLGRNVQISLATKLQELSTLFRKTQSSYLSKLRGREARNKDQYAIESQSESLDDDNAVFTDAQLQTVQNNERAITQREKEINEIVKSMLGVADIFRELHTMVLDQGTVLDRIDYNIEMTNVHVEEAHKQLTTGAKYQAKTGAKLLIIFLSLFVFIFLLVLIFKLFK